MIQINLLSIGEFIKKYRDIGYAIILLLFMFNCNSELSHADIIKERDKENKSLVKKVDSLQFANKSKDKIIAKSEKKVLEYQKKNDLLIGQIAKEKAKGEKQIAEQKKYNLKQWQKFYQEKSGYGDKDISIANNTLNFTRLPLVAIGNQLVKADVVKAELKLTKSILTETQNIVVEKDKIIEIGNQKIVTLQSIVDVKDEINENLAKNINDLNKDLKQARKPKLKPIIIGVVLGGIAGAILSN